MEGNLDAKSESELCAIAFWQFKTMQWIVMAQQLMGDKIVFR